MTFDKRRVIMEAYITSTFSYRPLVPQQKVLVKEQKALVPQQKGR